MSSDHRCTVSGRPAVNPADASVPNPERRPDGQHVDHWVLCPEERAKGYVRPLRRTYTHVGIRPKHPLRDLTPEEQVRFAGAGYVKYEEYPKDAGPTAALGRLWTAKQLASGCGSNTTMPEACAETYARQPGYYGSTFCCGCGDYFQVGAKGEFVWDGTDERVGT